MKQIIIKRILVEQYRGIADAAEALNVSQTHVRRFVQGKEQSKNMKKLFKENNIVVDDSEPDAVDRDVPEKNNEFFENRAYIPGIAEDARRLGVSRQYLSRVLHNQKRHGNARVMREYKALKNGDAVAV